MTPTERLLSFRSNSEIESMYQPASEANQRLARETVSQRATAVRPVPSCERPSPRLSPLRWD
jgi:hypothetical protein